MLSNRYIVLFPLVVILATAEVRADGCFVWNKGADLSEPTQKAIIYWKDGKEVLVLQVKYEGPAEDFAWIVPVPSKPEVAAIDAAKSPYAEISLYTQLRRRWGYRRKADVEEEEVTVLERKIVGVYDIAILAASEAGALSRWLNNNGYAFPAKRKDVLQHYTKKKWVYVAMRIDRKALAKDDVKKLKTGELQPICFTFSAKEMVYPLKISSINAGETEVLLYVLADGPMVLRGEHVPVGFSIEQNICRFPRYHDPEYGTYRKASGEELPLTWEALGLPRNKELSLCKYRSVYKTEEMTDDLVFVPFKPIPYWEERLGKAEAGNYWWLKRCALSVLAYHDADLLRKLATHADEHMRAVAAVNPKTPKEVFLKLARDADYSVRLELARNPGTLVDVLAVLAKDKNETVKRYLVWNPNTPVDILRTLGQDDNQRVRVYVAGDRKTPVDLLGKLARDSDARVRAAVARNPKTAPITLHELAKDKEAIVRKAVVSHPRAPLDILRRLAEDKNEGVRASLAWRKQTPIDILLRFARDESSRVRSNVVGNANLPEKLLEELASDKDSVVRRNVAWQRRAKPELLSVLARDESLEVRKAVALNMNTPLEALRELASDASVDVRYNVAFNSKTPVDILAELAKDKESRVREHVAENRHTPAEVLRRLADDERAEIRRKVSVNPGTPTGILVKLAQDKNPAVIRGVIWNANTPVELLRKLAKDDREEVREGVALNPHTPLETLEELANDKDAGVARVARFALERRGRNAPTAD